MYKTTGTRGDIFSFILNDERIVDLRYRYPASYTEVIKVCKDMLNLFAATPRVTIDNTSIQLGYNTGAHLHMCIIRLVDFAITIFLDGKIVEADITPLEAIQYFTQYLNRADDAAIVEISDVRKTSAFVFPSLKHMADNVSMQMPVESKKKKIKISITYTREVSVGDSTFSSVMDQVAKLCEVQPHELNNGFTLSGTSIAIADN